MFPRPECISVCTAPAFGSCARTVPGSLLGHTVTGVGDSASAHPSLPTRLNPLPALRSREGWGAESQGVREHKWQRLLICHLCQSHNQSFWGCKEEGCLQKVQVEQNGRKLTTRRVLRMVPFLVYEKAESCYFLPFILHDFFKSKKKDANALHEILYTHVYMHVRMNVFVCIMPVE